MGSKTAYHPSAFVIVGKRPGPGLKGLAKRDAQHITVEQAIAERDDAAKRLALCVDPNGAQRKAANNAYLAARLKANRELRELMGAPRGQHF